MGEEIVGGAEDVDPKGSPVVEHVTETDDHVDIVSIGIFAGHAERPENIFEPVGDSKMYVRDNQYFRHVETRPRQKLET